jgi:hypothetical protein
VKPSACFSKTTQTTSNTPAKESHSQAPVAEGGGTGRIRPP